MKTTISSLILVLSAALVLGANHGKMAYFERKPLSTNDPVRQLLDSAMRVQPLSDGSLMVIHRLEGFEANAFGASIVQPDGSRAAIRAKDCLPEGDARSGAAGQIYSGAILDDRTTLVLAIGWTNAKGRNINGLAILGKSGSTWKPRHVIVLSGSVRDIAAGPADSIAALTVTPAGGEGRARNDLLILQTDGSILLELKPWGGGEDSRENAEARAIAARLQRSGASDIALLDVLSGVASVFRLDIGKSDPSAHQKDFFLYPRYAEGSKNSARRSRLFGFSAAPAGSEGFVPIKVEAAHLNGDGSLSVVRQGLKGGSTTVFVSTYGRPEGIRTVSSNVLWKGVWLEEGSAHALELAPDRADQVRARTP
ncbi:MAG: hypothetical protein WBX15_13550 [Thermoanaerobaculia bacterium]